MRKLLLLLLLSPLLINSVVSGQSGLIKLSGKIIDAENGSALSDATVTAGAKSGRSDVEGNFFLLVPKDQTYTVSVSTIGYAPKEVGEVVIKSYEIPPLSISMKRTNKELQTVTVSANARREAQASLYNIQKNSSAISDGVSAEVIRKSPDKNTGDVLKRVSGASIQDNKFVVIRGLSERYNESMLNNSILPSTEADKKAFSFDIIPSSVVDNLVIYKSATPDLPGDFSGGAIKVSTKDYPSKHINELSLAVGYNTLTTGKNFYNSLPNGRLDQLGFLDNSRLMPGSFYRNRYGFINKSAEFKNAVTKSFPNTFGYTAAVQSTPTINVGYTGGNTAIHSNGTKLGYIYSIGYSNGRAVAERERNNYDQQYQHLYDYTTDNYEQRNSLSALLNVTYSYGKSKISLKNLFNNSFTKFTSLRGGVNTENQDAGFFNIRGSNSEVSQNGLANSVLEGLHRIGQNLTIDWNGSFAYTYKNQPDQRILTFRSANNSDDGYYLGLSNENSPAIRDAGRVYSFLNEKIYGISANATKQFSMFDQMQKLKFGTMNYYRDRDVEADAVGYAVLGRNRLVLNESKDLTFNNIFSPENVGKYNLTLANIESNSAQYTGTGMLNAGYAMLDNKFSEKFKLTWGVRVEKYHQELSARNKATKVYDNTDVLPSFLLTYSLDAHSNLRLAGSQAVNRPEFRELAEYSVYDYDLNVSIKGNPALQRCRNTNADLRYEWFPAAGEIISASLFYKYFDKPIEQVNLNNDVLSYENADHATAYGAEIEIRKTLNFIGGKFFDNLAFYANGAYIKGSVLFNGVNVNSALQGQSPYLINGGLNYTTDNDFSFNILYNRIGPRLRFRAASDAALNIYEKPRDAIDVQISKKFLNKKLEAKFTVSDILAQPFTWYYKYDKNISNTNYKAGEDRVINTIKYGTTATLSLRYSLGK